MKRSLILGAFALLACEQGGEPAAPPEPRPPEVAMTKADDVPSIATPEQADPAALEALVKATPTDPPLPTGEDGDTLVGTDTGQPGEEIPNAASTSTPRIVGGAVEIPPQLSSPAIEREARAQIYWSLRRCKGPDGRPPPPESITLAFTLREDGTVDPASVIASAEREALQPTAECVLRAFSATPFEGPMATRRTPARIRITWPSVD